MKYKEMLEKANIPFEFLLSDRLQKIKSMNELYDLEHKAYISFSGGKDSTVLGYLSAENVFERIKKHYQSQNSNDTTGTYIKTTDTLPGKL